MSGASRRSAALTLTGLSLAGYLTAMLGTLALMPRAGRFAYVFVFPDGRRLAAAWLVSVILVVAIDWGARRAAARAPRADSAAGEASWWGAPLAVLGLLVAGLVPAVPGVGPRAAPFAYLFYDLRWWWTAVFAGWSAIRLDRACGGPCARWVARVGAWRPAARLLLLDVLVFSSTVAWATATMPTLRFSQAVHGDEPKYLRYCETLYQGRGVDISHNTLFDDWPLDASSRLSHNLVLFAQAVRQDAGFLAADLAAFVQHPLAFKWNRARPSPNWFLYGRNGGFYQVHQPGLSLLLLPGYYLDRRFLGVRPGYQDEFPDDLVMTNASMLLFYAIGAVALFRLLRRATGAEGLAAACAAGMMMIVPMTSFAFQWYPEIPAAVAIVGVTNFLFFHRDRPWAAAAAGAAAAGLEWLHPRFILVSLALAAFAWLWCRGAARHRFLAAYALVLLTVCAWAYHLTGSWMPTAMYSANPGDEGFLLSIVPLNLVANAFDRNWGIVPHAVVLLLAPAGWALMAREDRRAALFLAVVGLGLAIPTAGHGLGAGGATPGRHMLAVLPLAAWPLAMLALRSAGQPGWRLLLVCFSVLSLQTALAYNWFHEKVVGRLVDPQASGWMLNLAFPWMRTAVWRESTANFLLLLALAGLGVALAWLALRTVPAAGAREPVGMRGAPAWLAALMAPVVAACLVAATAANREWTSADYAPAPDDSVRALAVRLVQPDRFVAAMASTDGRFTWRDLTPNGARAVRVAPAASGSRATVRVAVDGDDGLAFGRARVDFGDGTLSPWLGVVDAIDVGHTYARPGRYEVAAWLELRDGSLRVSRETLAISQ